jgi:hypothetical protein
MRWQRSMIVFALTLLIGLSLGLRLFITGWLWPSFSKDEAVEKIGRQVRFRRSEKFLIMKCSTAQPWLERQPCLVVDDGELGTVIGIEPDPGGGYSLKVRWNRHTQHYTSYFGRYTYRESLNEQ